MYYYNRVIGLLKLAHSLVVKPKPLVRATPFLDMALHNALELFSLGLPQADVRRKELKGKSFRAANAIASAISESIRDWRSLQLVIGTFQLLEPKTRQTRLIRNNRCKSRW